MIDRFVAKVVDVANDPEKSGRVKIRIFGIHDDVSRIPDEALPWARLLFPVTNPIHAGVAGPTTGMVVGTTVMGYFADPAHQIPIVAGTLGRVTEKESDFPAANNGEDINPVLNENIFEIGVRELKYAEARTIGTAKFIGQSVNDMLDDIGEGDIAGAIRQIKSIRNQIASLKNQISVSPLNQVSTIIQGYVNDFGSIIEDEVDDLVANELGNIFTGATPESVLSNIVGTTPGAKLINQVISATGVEFTSANHLASSIGNRLSKKVIGSAQDALNRIDGHKFVMNNTMKHLENSMKSIKAAAKRKV